MVDIFFISIQSYMMSQKSLFFGSIWSISKEKMAYARICKGSNGKFSKLFSVWPEILSKSRIWVLSALKELRKIEKYPLVSERSVKRW